MVGMADWAGRVGREWADKADAMDGLIGPVGAVGIAAMGDVTGQRVLDLGCGAGDTSFMLADAGAAVTGLDVSPDLLAVARELDTQSRVEWVLDDASTHSFATPFDALHSRCGAMFFEDPQAAWSHLHSQVKPDGKLVVTCWQPPELNGWVTVPLDAARPILGGALTQLPSIGGPGPFGWSAQDYVEPLLTGAGWRDVEWQAVDHPARISTGNDPDPVERAVLFMMRIGTLASNLRKVDDETRLRVADALRVALAPLVQDGFVQVPTAGWCITARA
ncbi:Methyltransferase domain-containing protein [Monaibacterium marinum]|uniref:Methyltransferase domain-containing protein n=1 Tax=Pontivivens marinum TaxID=1690039 RepID=A0A2C9CQL1_9RHOB|nr:class I SAM-dependent methyltransferase [Monaibacterium marinum]SOH93500.1 Methyltransferase domain-containing protein [Monaibacterium marinum]